MTKEDDTVAAAQTLQDRNVDDLLMLLARREEAIEADPSLADDPTLDVDYKSSGMPAETLRAMGRKIMLRWNRALFDLVCKSSDDADRKKLVDAFGLGETALIGAVASLLLTITNPAIAAAAAAIIVKHFILPAGGVVCETWEEAIDMEA